VPDDQEMFMILKQNTFYQLELCVSVLQSKNASQKESPAAQRACTETERAHA
jgi:hypothetical protein